MNEELGQERYGVVSWFSKEKGYGFIQTTGRDYFVHFKDLNVEGYKTIQAKQKVRFNEVQSSKGWVAKNVFLE